MVNNKPKPPNVGKTKANHFAHSTLCQSSTASRVFIIINTKTPLAFGDLDCLNFWYEIMWATAFAMKRVISTFILLA